MFKSIGFTVPSSSVHTSVFGKVMLQEPVDANNLKRLRATLAGKQIFSG